MRTLSASELLSVWEQGAVQSTVPWAITLLAAACQENSPDELAQLPIGQRDGRLLTLYEWTFGPALMGLAACPVCQEQLQLPFQINDIRIQPGGGEPASSGWLQVEAYEVHFRLPNSIDVMAVDTAEALWQRCVTQINRNGQEQPAATLPQSVITAVITHMSQIDPQADIQLALTCPACQHPWRVAFDIITFFWHRLNMWAYRLLYESHLLAAAYGWHEADILAMTPWRRHFYLEMVRNRP